MVTKNGDSGYRENTLRELVELRMQNESLGLQLEIEHLEREIHGMTMASSILQTPSLFSSTRPRRRLPQIPQSTPKATGNTSFISEGTQTVDADTLGDCFRTIPLRTPVTILKVSSQTSQTVENYQQSALRPEAKTIDKADARVYMKPATYDGTGSWIAHFEACAEINKWTPEQKGLYLSVCLRGQGVFGNLAGNML
jgi:hypothetical protein